uniref:Uncharacterized protein n=1 Tax=Rhizophora mucronata TaxID=61149 RepID=A0A2P2J9M2_RHIMU
MDVLGFATKEKLQKMKIQKPLSCSAALLVQNLENWLLAFGGSIDIQGNALQEFGTVVAAWIADDAQDLVLAAVKGHISCVH